MTVVEDAIEWLRELPPRRQLASSLGVPQGTVTCYYAAAFKNTLSILKEGLRCKNDPNRPAAVDLSARSIQVRRRDAYLGREGDRCRYDLHDCLNLLLNPFSQTRQAFQKNAMIRRTLDADAWPVCVLEYDLSALLSLEGIAWAIANKNVAAGGYTAFTAAQLQEPRYQWDSIYSLPGPSSTVDETKSARAAEVLLHLGVSPQSTPLRSSFLRRILVRPSDLSDAQAEALKSALSGPVAIAHVPALDPDARHLLHHESELLASRLRMWVAKACRDAFVFEEETQLSPALSRFARPESGENWKHGQGHIVRVMVWSAYLARALKLNAAEHRAAMIAAAIHDLDRLTDDADEPEHGRRAADRHRSQVLELLKDAHVAKSCLEAVRFHCLDDADAQNKDALWKTLKDADALDRGRFGPPVDPSSNGKGCRLGLLRDKCASREAAWVAFRLAKATAYMNWDKDRPVSSLRDYLDKACREVIKLGIPAHVTAANRFLKELFREGDA